MSKTFCPSPLVAARQDVHTTLYTGYENCAVPCPSIVYEPDEWSGITNVMKMLTFISVVLSSLVLVGSVCRINKRIYIRTMFISGFLANSVSLAAFLFVNIENDLICDGDAHYVMRSDICVLQSFCTIFSFIWIVSWALIFAVDIYLQIRSMAGEYDSSIYHSRYTWVALIASLLISMIPLCVNNLGFDPYQNIPMCFFITSEESSYFWLLFFAPACVLVVAAVAVTMFSINHIQSIYENSRKYDLARLQHREQQRQKRALRKQHKKQITSHSVNNRKMLYSSDEDSDSDNSDNVQGDLDWSVGGGTLRKNPLAAESSKQNPAIRNVGQFDILEEDMRSGPINIASSPSNPVAYPISSPFSQSPTPRPGQPWLPAYHNKFEYNAVLTKQPSESEGDFYDEHGDDSEIESVSVDDNPKNSEDESLSDNSVFSNLSDGELGEPSTCAYMYSNRTSKHLLSTTKQRTVLMGNSDSAYSESLVSELNPTHLPSHWVIWLYKRNFNSGREVECGGETTRQSETALSYTAHALASTWRQSGRSIVFVLLFSLSALVVAPLLYYVFHYNYAAMKHSTQHFIECLIISTEDCVNSMDPELPPSQIDIDNCAKHMCGSHPSPRNSRPLLIFIMLWVSTLGILPSLIFGFTGAAGTYDKHTNQKFVENVKRKLLNQTESCDKYEEELYDSEVSCCVQ